MCNQWQYGTIMLCFLDATQLDEKEHIWMCFSYRLWMLCLHNFLSPMAICFSAKIVCGISRQTVILSGYWVSQHWFKYCMNWPTSAFQPVWNTDFFFKCLSSSFFPQLWKHLNKVITCTFSVRTWIHISLCLALGRNMLGWASTASFSSGFRVLFLKYLFS